MRGGDEQPADHDIRAARFVDDGGAEGVVFFFKDTRALRDRTFTEIRAARDNDARRLAGGMGIDDVNAIGGGAHRAPLRLGMVGRLRMPSRMICRIVSRSAPARGRRGARIVSLPRPHSCTASLM